MQLHQMLQTEPHLLGLIEQSKYFQSLDKQIKTWLPENLTAHFRVVCLSQGTLILHVSGSMAASRLKMLLPALLPRIQQLDNRILDCKVHVLPSNPPRKKVKTFHIPPSALAQFKQTAERVRHHEDLHQAICQLIQHHENYQ